VLLGEDASPLPARVRLLAPEDLWDQVAPEARATLQAARARVEGVLGAASPVQAALDGFDAMYWHFRHIQGREAWNTDGGFIRRYAPPLGPGVAERFAWSSQVSDEQASQATAFRARLRAHLDALLGTDGVFVMPTMPDIAPLRSAPESTLEDYRNRAIRMLCIAGLAGLPQLSLPLAGRDGAPLGLSLMGPAGSDASLVRLAQRIVGEG
jgi:amidase